MNDEMNGVNLIAILPSILIFLALFLAISPLIILGQSQGGTVITTADLSEAQISSLQDLNLARMPSELREGLPAINQVLLQDNGNLILAGTWVGEFSLQNFTLISNGGRDIFVTSLDYSGNFTAPISGGSEGEDSVVSIIKKSNSIMIFGEINGDAIFGNKSIEDNSNWSSTPFQAFISQNLEWILVSEIDRELLPETSQNLWCGF